ncbi:hypothetical protein V8G54_006566 [Vigna mungo]|uniref:Reverse transcriptase Ty1/copia-type domain-containing protein n=1 Tax=Vigna mungo TaxID=3915 RepID=A0AAQ3P031_VIGMU
MSLSATIEPTSFKEACQHDHCQQTMLTEIQAIHKARIVSKGFTQTQGMDFFETFSPVVKLTTVRFLISIAASRNWFLYQLDVDNAFLHGDLDEEVYMKPPLGLLLPEPHLGLMLNQRKYCLEILAEFGLTGCKPSPSPSNPTVKLRDDANDLVLDPTAYKRLICKLQYLTNTRPDISFVVQQKSKKQSTVSKSSTEAEYRTLTFYIVDDLCLQIPLPFPTFCDNQSAIQLAKNPSFHERSKHIEVDCHLIRAKILDGLIVLSHVPSKYQLVDMLTKSLYPEPSHDNLFKIGLLNIHHSS